MMLASVPHPFIKNHLRNNRKYAAMLHVPYIKIVVLFKKKFISKLYRETQREREKGLFSYGPSRNSLNAMLPVIIKYDATKGKPTCCITK